MPEPGVQSATWTDRMELLRDSAQQRLLEAPMPADVMDRLLTDGKAAELGLFEGSPVRYMSRWWRKSESGWEALDEEATAELDQHAERYRAATASLGLQEGAPAETPGTAKPLASSRPGAGEA
ncbi:hypothetical protein ABZ864_40355 [Streptomyces sp. NPDC047082]|uniref:hypothetical protein n=1 Tax=Streptomyces sp. NPDC047082 TaxID=3155259 RepID=UPI0033D50070